MGKKTSPKQNTTTTSTTTNKKSSSPLSSSSGTINSSRSSSSSSNSGSIKKKTTIIKRNSTNIGNDNNNHFKFSRKLSHRSRLNKHIDFLKYFLSQSDETKSKKLLFFCNDNEIDALCDCLFNAVSNPQFKISRRQRHELKQHENHLHKLFSKHSTSAKREHLKRNYKIFYNIFKSYLAPAIISFVTNFVLKNVA